MLGARAIGPGAGSTAAAGGLMSAAAGGGGGSTGAHAASQSAIATGAAADRATQIRRAARLGFSRGAIALSLVSGIGVPPESCRREFTPRPSRTEYASAAGAPR